MRQQIISKLIYPRLLVKDHLDLDDCDHSGRYDLAARDCEKCDDEPECHWLYDTDEFELLQQRPLEELVDALEFALGYVGAEVSRLRHSRQRCNCESCVWLRDALRLFEAVQEI